MSALALIARLELLLEEYKMSDLGASYMKTYEKESYILKFNMDVVVKPIKIIYNDDVKDLKEAREVLRKFTLVKK